MGIKIRGLIGTGLLLFAGGESWAASTSSTFATSAVIAAACTVAADNLTFGTYAPGTPTALAGSANVNVWCSTGTTYSLALNVGSAGGLFTARVLANGLNLLGYNLFTSAAHTTIWGDGTLLTGVVSGTGLGLLTASSNTVYGLIPIAQDLPAGTYTSTVTVTVNY